MCRGQKPEMEISPPSLVFELEYALPSIAVLPSARRNVKRNRFSNYGDKIHLVSNKWSNGKGKICRVLLFKERRRDRR